MELTFSTLWDGYPTDRDALAARNKKAKELRKLGHKVYCNCLRNQMKQYDGLGKPNGKKCNVYCLSCY